MQDIEELSEKSIQILDKTGLTANSLVMVKVDISTMPPLRGQQYMQSIVEVLRGRMAPAEVLVIPQTVEVSVYERTRSDTY